jgi:hypothetical protein
VIVHGNAFPRDDAEPVKQWLVSRGAVEVQRDDAEVLFVLPR